MELRHLRYFQSLAIELHFGKAAEKLFITQPALSKQINQLEEELGVKLFERNKRNVALTEAGDYLAGEAEYVINHIERVAEVCKRKAKGEKGEIRIGFVGSAMQNIIPDLLTDMNKQHPLVHANLEELSNKSQLQQLRNDKLDIGFVRMESVPQNLQKKVVYEDTFSLVTPKDHPVTKHGLSDFSELKDDSFILFSNDYSQDYFNNIMGIFDDHGFKPKVSYRSVQSNSIFRLVEKGLGVAVVPTALSQGVDLGIKFISLDYLPQRTRLLAVWHPQNRNKALGQFLELL